MVAESVRFLKDAGLRVFFDSEHFFDGYKANPEYALRVLEAAATNGPDCLVMCDTNGGYLPHPGQRIAREVHAHFRAHPHHRLHTHTHTTRAVPHSVTPAQRATTHTPTP